MRLVKIQAYDRTMAAVEISAPGKISAPSQNLSGKVWRPLTIWARQNLPLLTSPWSGWRALVQILVDVLILRNVDLKWSEGSGHSAFMGGVSPVLYRLVVPARPVKISAGVQILCTRTNFHHFLWKLKNSISASNCPITAPKIRTWSLLLSKFSYHIHRLLNGGHPLLWARLPRSVHNPPGGVWGGGNGSAGRLPLLSPCYRIWWGEWEEWGGGEGGERESKHVLAQNAAMSIVHVVFTLSLFLISPFCCCSLSRHKKVPQERYSDCVLMFLFSDWNFMVMII